MIRIEPTVRTVAEKLREFNRVAGVLKMPEAERLGILNVTPELYQRLCAGEVEAACTCRAEIHRRMTYALPTMRRLAGSAAAARPLHWTGNPGSTLA